MTEFICDDCMDGDHEACRRQGGWPYQETNERCACHLSAHAFDNRLIGADRPEKSRGISE